MTCGATCDKLSQGLASTTLRLLVPVALRVLYPPARVELILPAFYLCRAHCRLGFLAAMRFGNGIDQGVALRIFLVDELFGDLSLRQGKSTFLSVPYLSNGTRTTAFQPSDFSSSPRPMTPAS